MIPKQDRQGVRHARDIEQKYDLNTDFTAIKKIAADAQRIAEKANSTIADVVGTANEAKEIAVGMSAQIEDILKRLAALEAGGGGSVLPSGYTLLEYIQSSGTQYIDTGFKPNQDTQVIIDAEILSSNASGDRYISAVNTGSGYWTMRMKSDLSGYAARYPGAALTNITHSGDVYARHTFNQNKNVVQIDDGTAVTFTASTWSSPRTLPILCYRSSDSAYSGHINAKLYSCQIYDNGTLIRDYVPVINPSGEYGLYDKVNATFYGNAGSGTFTGS